MKEKLVVLIKRFKFIYNIYFYIFNFLLNILGAFVKIDNKLILINSFGGKKYDDSPKEIYEAMIKDIRFKEYKFVWAFHNPEEFNIPQAIIIKTDTYNYFKTALKAKCWITNSGIERGLNFKKKETFYFNTWHGTPIKKMGIDLSLNNESFASKSSLNVNVMLAQGDFEADIFSRVFKIPREKFLLCGLPRNDKLANYTNEKYVELRNKIGIPLNKKVILYAPTFREYERDSKHNCILKPPVNLEKWRTTLGDEYLLLFRAHYEVSKAIGLCDNEFVRDMSSYPALDELMIISDILISDYSSIFFDFSIMDKPMYYFTYDYEEYSNKRGMYFDIREQLEGSDEEEKLLKIVIHSNSIEAIENTRKFRNKYINYYGEATKRSLDVIIENIGG